MLRPKSGTPWGDGCMEKTRHLFDTEVNVGEHVGAPIPDELSSQVSVLKEIQWVDIHTMGWTVFSGMLSVG